MSLWCKIFHLEKEDSREILRGQGCQHLRVPTTQLVKVVAPIRTTSLRRCTRESWQEKINAMLSDGDGDDDDETGLREQREKR